MERAPLTKAYDTDALLQRLKARGLDLAEEALGILYEESKQWFIESAPLSENKIDDVIAPFAPQLDLVFKPLIDKVNGREG